MYTRAWALYQECMHVMGLNPITISELPLNYKHILLFMSYLQIKGLAPATITTYLSAIGYVHKARAVVDPTTQFLVQKVLSSINKLHGTRDSRLPITLLILHRLLESIDKVITNVYHSKLLKAMFLVAFYGLFRVGEITVQKSGNVSLYFNQLLVLKDCFQVQITSFKNNKTNKPFDIVIHKQPGGHCPYQALLNYLSVRGCDSGPLFRFLDKSPVSRNFFTSRLKNCISFCGLDPRLFKSHSFRIGSASYLASIGKSDLQIKLMGRWSSDSFLRYIRNQKFNIFHR